MPQPTREEICIFVENSISNRAFNQELMLRIASEEDRLISDADIEKMWFSRKNLLKHISSYNIYFTTDFTASNDRKGDFSTVMAWAVGAGNNWFMLDVSCKRQTMEEQEVTLLDMVRKHTYENRQPTVGVEIDGQQQYSIHSLKKEMLNRNIFFQFARQIGAPYTKLGISRKTAKGAKHTQFMRTHTLFQSGNIFFCEEVKDTPDMKEVLEELKYITWESISSKHDDALDCISMISTMQVLIPTVEVSIEETPAVESKQTSFGMLLKRPSQGSNTTDSYESYV
jgi:phage terminase large subunit-like protein